MGDSLPCVGLLDSPLDFGQKQQPFHDILDRCIIWEIRNGVYDFFSDGHIDFLTGSMRHINIFCW